MKLAAIDIGSNAARLLITEVIPIDKKTATFKKIILLRVPLRLGFDVFEKGRIMKHRADLLLETMKSFSHLINAFEIKHTKTCATSAMRDAKNAQEIIARVKDETGILIEVITGEQEASFVFENHIAENLDKQHSYLYIDVGGGSTEITLYNLNKMVFKDSFDIGTIRLLKGQVSEKSWEEMRNSIKSNTKNIKNIIAIGSGGNINKVQTMSKRKEGNPLPFQLLKKYYKDLSGISVEERIRLYSLRDDRADVIVPALEIYTRVMNWANAAEIYVPKIGLADGLIQHLWKEKKNMI